MTKGGTFIASMGLLVTIAWVFIWPIGGYTDYSGFGEVLSRLVLSIGAGGMFMGPMVGGASMMREWKESKVTEAVRAWKRQPSEPLPPVQAGDANIVVDTSNGEIHGLDIAQYGRFALQALIGGAPIALGTIAWLGFSRALSADYESTINTKGGLLWSGVFTVGPVLIVTITWLALYLTRHSIEIHPNGITIRGIWRRYTFSNSSNTLMVVPGIPENHRTAYFIDRTTGRRMSTWMMPDELMSQFGPGKNYMDKVILVDEPRKDIARYMTLFTKQPVLIVSLIAWYIGAVCFYVMFALNPDLF